MKGTGVTMLSTNFSQTLDYEHILSEYPRPNLQRNSYINLNGYWDYAFTLTNSRPTFFEGKILVPFSPESELSGVKRRLEPREFLWYHTIFDSPLNTDHNRLILHFGAVDQYAAVFINDRKVCTHMGGYLPFSVDITDYLANDINSLLVMVRDVTDTSYHARGKQKLNPGGMFYTAQSGIWQTVWMECVPNSYIKNLIITPNYDERTVHIQITSSDDNHNTSKKHTSEPVGEVVIFDGDTLITKEQIPPTMELTLALNTMKSWSPDHPFLYDLKITYKNDSIKSYFAMRKFSTAPDSNGTMRLFLNNEPYFHNGLLDQGYWPESLYTPPSDDALIFDIATAKKLGFNMLRKHAKIEPLRWYYHCDRLGMLVWQDMVNGGSSYRHWLVTYFPTLFPQIARKIKDKHYTLLSRASKKGRIEFLKETKETVSLLYNFPCVAMWVPFNEAWGQFNAKMVTSFIQSLDATRTIDSASGWFDQNTGDVRSLHIYFTPFKFRKERRAVVLSEFGGYVLRIKNHSYSNKTYGYRIYKSPEQLTRAFYKLYKTKIIPGIINGLSATVYTQLTDIEEEINGLLTYDRKVLKLDAKRVQSVNKLLQKQFKQITCY